MATEPLKSVSTEADAATRRESATLALGSGLDVGDVPPGTRFGHYRVLELLGRGGMGAVYLAEQAEPFRRQVALKLVQQARPDSSLRVRFEFERQTLALLAHPGIAQILDAGSQPDGVAWFAMEYVQGRTLDQWWQSVPDLRPRLTLLLELCRAVGHANRRGIAHCDLKPNNVLVVDDVVGPRPKVIDFGIARVIGSDDAVSTDGTPGYMAPEQRAGTTLDARTDVYALGICTLRALGAPAPGPEDRPLALAREALDALPMARLRRAELESLLRRALEDEPAARYEDAYALADEIDRWLRHLPLEVLSASRIYRLRCWFRRNRWPTLGVLAFVAMAAIFTVQLVAQYQQTRTQRDTAEQVVSLLVDTFAAADPIQYPGGSATARELLAAAANRVHRQALPSAVRVRLLEVLGTAQYSLELYDDARQSFTRALDVIPVSSQRERDRLRLLLARVESDAENYAVAEPIAHEILTNQRLANPDLAIDSLLLLADNALLGDDVEAATRFAEQARALASGTPGSEYPRLLAVMRARIAHARGNPRAAMEAQREALSSAEQGWSADDLRMLDLVNDMALYAGQAGAHDEAIAQFERVAELTAAAWGSDSAGLATVLGNLGVNRLRAGDAAGAEAEHRAAARMLEHHLGTQSMYTATEYNNLAAAIEAQGRPAEALPWFEKAEAGFAASVGAEHFRVGVTLHNHARALLAIGDLQRSRELLDRSAAILEPALGAEHPRWQVWRTSDAQWRLIHGDASGAVAVLRDVVPLLDQAFGAHSREARRAQQLLIQALLKNCDCRDAMQVRQSYGPEAELPPVSCEGP